MNKLRKDVEEANIQQESILSNLKRKQGDATAEMTEQVLHPWTKDFYFYLTILLIKTDCETGMVIHFQVRVDKRLQLETQEAESYTKLVWQKQWKNWQGQQRVSELVNFLFL